MTVIRDLKAAYELSIDIRENTDLACSSDVLQTGFYCIGINLSVPATLNNLG